MLELDGKAWKLSALPRCLTILALLAASRGNSLNRARLAVTVWPDDLESDARTKLRRHLHRLQRALPDIDGVEWILVDGESVGWNAAAPVWIDVRAFVSACADPQRRGEAIELYRGDLLEGCYDECIIAERERLRSAYVNMLETGALQARLDRDFSSAILLAEKLLAVDDWCEDAVRVLMAAAYESGDRTGALAAYERFARKLHDEFGVEPTGETVALRNAIGAGLSLPDERSSLSRGEPDLLRQTRSLPFVGRAKGFDQLSAMWSKAARGSGGVAFVSGEAGVGKSRLTAELCDLVRSQGGLALVGRTSSPESEPYQSWLSALHRALARADVTTVETPWLAALAPLLPELVQLVPNLPQSEPLPEERARERLFESFARIVERIAKSRPLCLVLEDLHWAGQVTVDLLATVARRAGTLPILVVATYRSEESNADHPIRSLRATLVRERRAVALALDRLAVEDVAAMLRSVLVDDVQANEVAGAIAAHSEGNPLFAAQLLEAYRESRLVPDVSSAVRTIGDVIAIRARNLDEETNTVAQVAAVLGEAFRADIAADVVGLDESRVFSALGELIDRGIVREAGGGALEYVFTHALVAASFYEAMPKAVVAARHRRTAQVLARVFGEDRRTIGAIALHWKLGGEAERAAKAFAIAAKAAYGVYARKKALEYAREAIDLLPEGADRERFDLLSLIVDAQSVFANRTECEKGLRALESAAERLGDRERFAAQKAWTFYYMKAGARAEQSFCIDRLFALSEKLDSSSRGDAFRALADLKYTEGALHEAVEAGRAALGLARSTGDEMAELRACEKFVQSLVRVGRADEAMEHLRALEEFASPAAPHEVRTLFLQSLMFVLVEQRDTRRALDVGKEMLERARLMGDLNMELQALSNLAFGGMRHSKVSEVRARLGEALAICERTGWTHGLWVMPQNRAVFELSVGHAERALEIVEAILPQLEELGELSVLGALLTRTECQLLLGQAGASLETAQNLERRATAAEASGLIAAARLAIGKAAFALGDRAEALSKMREAVEMRRKNGPVSRLMEASCACLTALLEAERLDEAATVATELRDLYQRCMPQAARPVEMLAALAREAAARGDRAQADDLLKQARAILDEELTRIDDEETRAVYLALPHNRAVTAVVV